MIWPCYNEVHEMACVSALHKGSMLDSLAIAVVCVSTIDVWMRVLQFADMSNADLCNQCVT